MLGLFFLAAILSAQDDVDQANVERLTAEVSQQVTELAQNQGMQQLMLSVSLCFFAELRKGAVARVKEERAYAKELGVSDDTELLSMQRLVKQSDRENMSAKKRLAKLQVKARSCSDPAVASIAMCLSDRLDGKVDIEECSSTPMASMMLLAYRVVPALQPLSSR